MTDIPNSPDPAQTVSQLGETLRGSLAQTAESHRVLVQEMTGFAKDESLRFVNLRLERNGAALDKLQHCHGIPGLIGVQQEWLRDFLQDYTSQSMRMMGAWRGLTKNVIESAAENAADNIDRMQHQASDMAHQAEDAIHRTGNAGYQAAQQADEQIGNIVSDTNNNYVQH
jgi:ElaB/YqjD/DUF883 family membrane-anchored ribosome-binding protein